VTVYPTLRVHNTYVPVFIIVVWLLIRWLNDCFPLSFPSLRYNGGRYKIATIYTTHTIINYVCIDSLDGLVGSTVAFLLLFILLCIFSGKSTRLNPGLAHDLNSPLKVLPSSYTPPDRSSLKFCTPPDRSLPKFCKSPDRPILKVCAPPDPSEEPSTHI
jgi:hypothetical protein